MFDLDRWQEIYHVLTANKLRTFLTAFGVFWGIFMLVILMGSGNGLENGAKGNFGSFATNSVYIWGQSTSMPYNGFKRGRWIGFDNEDTKALQDIEGVEVLCPKNQLGGHRGSNNVQRGKYYGAFQVSGDVPEIVRISPRKMLKGRFINDLDQQEKRKVAVIGERVAEVLFDSGEDPIGEYIEINGIYFMVIGVFDLYASGDFSERELERIHIPFSTFQQAFNYVNRVGWFSVLSESNIPVSTVEARVREVLKKRHNIHPDDPRALGSFNAEEQFNKMNFLFIGIRLLVWFVGIGTLLAGVIGVSNIMLVVVKERTKEIGIRKAIGATPASIVIQILLESITLTSIAGYLGLVFAVGALEGVNAMIGEGAGMFKNPEIDFNAAVISLIILIIGGTLAGLIPAQKAASVNPIIALRGE